jgi:deoxyribonuclease-4
MSIAGGYHNAVLEAVRTGCDVVQLFTKNNNQWRAKPITDEDAALFRTALAESHVTHPVAHASYLINLASPDELLRQKSIAGLIVELERADQLGIP